MSFKLVHGDYENLTGNCIVYWDIEGDNVFSPGSKVIAANFTISSLPLDDKLLTATFPPIAFEDFDTLFEKVINISCDIIYGGKLQFPDTDNEFKRFYKKQFVKYNRIIQDYSNKFKSKLDFKPELLSEKEKLYMLKKILKKVRKNISSSRKEENNSKNYRVKKLVESIQTKYEKYDVHNIYKIVYKPGEDIDKLTELYADKFISIYDEDYEKANKISKAIKKLEKKIYISK